MEPERFKKEILVLREDLFRYAWKFLENDPEAEDVIQELFLRLWYNRNKLDNHPNLRALCFQATRNLCLNHLKVMKRNTGEKSEEIEVPISITPHIQLELKDSVEKVFAIINTLPDLQKTIFRMKHADGYEVEEIAEITGSSPEAIRMNLSRARRKVKELFLKTEGK